MFTVAQIQQAHAAVKSGADFPAYTRAMRELGVLAFETWVMDSHTEYFGADGYKTTSSPMYEPLVIADKTDEKKFVHYLEIHQQGQTDYNTFCRHCAETGIEKWFVNLEALTCTYFDKAGTQIFKEPIPG